MAGKPVGSFYVGLGLDTREFQRKMRLAERDLQAAFGSAAIRTSQALAASIAGVTAAVGYLGAKSVKLAADLEVQTKAFQRLLGGADAAKAKLKELQSFAAQTPFAFTEVTDATKRLLALGFAADEVISVLTSVGDAASGLGLDSGGMDRIIKAFGDIRSKGVLATQEIKQLAENGIPAFEILAQNLGVTIPEAMKLVEDRAISSQVAINAFMSGINERFGGMMEIQSQTMLGMWSTIVDEAENSMRIVGKQITQSAGLQSAMQRIRDEAIAFRTTLQDAGFSKAFSSIFGEGAQVAIAATAGAITASLIPSIVAAGIAIKTAISPLLPLIAAGVLVGGVIQIGVAVKNLSNETKQLAEHAENASKELSKTLTTVGAIENKNRILEIQRTLAYMRTEQEIQADINKEWADQHLALSKQSLAGYNRSGGGYAVFDNATIDGHGRMIKQFEEEKKVVVDLKTELDELKEIYKQQVRLNDPDYVQAYTSGRKLAISLAEGIRSFDLKQAIGSFFPNFMGLNPKPTKPEETTGGKSSVSDEDKRLADDAKRTSKSILQTYTSQVLGKKAMLDLEYQQERENLDRSKSQNKNYRRDLFMLDETYYQRRIELEREAADEEAKLNAEMAQSHADYIGEQMEADWAEAEANAQRIQAIQDGSALEAQLQADMQAADLDAYVAHLDQKQAAYRAHLEGNRNLMNVYDQLQRDAHRTNADFMAESYRTVYSGLTDALTGIVTGAKNAGEAFRELGMQIIQMVVKWQIQQKLASVMSASIRTATTAASVAQAAIITAAWAPAAAMVNAATFGAAATSGAAATAGAVSMMGAAARAFSPVPFANGGIVTKPTLAMIGEGGESEAVIPLSRLGEMGGGANVQVNVINQTGVPVNARSSQRMDGGKTVIDLFLEGYSRNVSGIQDIIGRRS